MKLGLGLYRQMLTPENFRFAKQAGATAIVAHLVDYFNSADSLSTATAGEAWGITTNHDRLWTVDELLALRRAVEAEGLQLAAIENFDPAHWYDVLLDGPRKQQQLENLKTIIRRMGQAGIPCMGYNFSIAGVWGRITTHAARGKAPSVGYIQNEAPPQTPLPNGQVWNMIYNPDASPGTVGSVTPEQLWQRLADFLEALVPVAEEAGVRLAAHPDDPPLETVRHTARLVYQPHLYQKLLDIKPSYYNGLEFCLGTLAEMSQGDIYQAIEQYSRQDKICYVHARNVRGHVPNYHEVFIDEGDIDMWRALRILRKNNFEGVIIPDHTPQMTCAAPWHAGMAYALGYLRALITVVEQE